VRAGFKSSRLGTREDFVVSEELAKLLFTGLGIAIGYFVKDYIDRRKATEAARIADRREHYRNLVLCLKSIAEGQRDKDELLRFEYSFLWLYAPDAVIRSFNALLHQMRSEAGRDRAASKAGELILEMRRDLGLKSSRLLPSEFEAGTSSLSNDSFRGTSSS
jgi:hypothetical protein